MQQNFPPRRPIPQRPNIPKRPNIPQKPVISEPKVETRETEFESIEIEEPPKEKVKRKKVGLSDGEKRALKLLFAGFAFVSAVICFIL